MNRSFFVRPDDLEMPCYLGSKPLNRQELLKLASVPIGSKSRKNLADVLRKAFREKRAKDETGLWARRMGLGGPKSKMKEYQELSKGPFEDYAFGGDCWGEYLAGIFRRLEDRFLLRIEKIRNVRENYSTEAWKGTGYSEISLEILETSPKMAREYIEELESFLLSWIVFLSRSNDFVFERLIFERYDGMVSRFAEFHENPAWEFFLGTRTNTHNFFIELVTICFMEDRIEESLCQKSRVAQLERDLRSASGNHEKTVASLRNTIARKVEEGLSTSVAHSKELSESRQETARLQDLLKRIGYDPDSKASPETWIAQVRQESVRGFWSEWEHVALEESRRADALAESVRSHAAYVAYLEHEFMQPHESPRKKYLAGKWKSGDIRLFERFECLALQPEICPRTNGLVTDSIAHIKTRISGTSLSSTNSKEMGFGSGHVANRIVSVLNFLSNRVAEDGAAALMLSWKEIVRGYFDSTDHKTANGAPFFTLLINALPDKPGNISDIETLTLALRSIETALKWPQGNDLKGLCDELTVIFTERMLILERQFANN